MDEKRAQLNENEREREKGSWLFLMFIGVHIPSLFLGVHEMFGPGALIMYSEEYGV